MRYGAASDVGRVRESNEDAYVAKPPLFAVADGMGGHSFGEIASAIAMRSVTRSLRRVPAGRELERLEQAIEDANREVFKDAMARAGHIGMGTTVTCAIVRPDAVHIGHVGDSRAYLLSDGRLTQITKDHSLVDDMVRSGELTAEEARYHPQRNVITRALGTEPRIAVDTLTQAAQTGDRLLLCTDGLTGMLRDDEIAEPAAAGDPAEACRKLVEAANEAGGEDNITVVLVEIGDQGGGADSGLWDSLTGWWKR